MRNYTLVGLTGPSGSGKSTFVKSLLECGFALIDADKLAREALAPPSPCVEQLKIVFGDDILRADGEINRPLLAKRAFSSDENVLKLNEITHPRIFMQTLKMIKEYVSRGENLIVFDAPVLLESGIDVICDIIVSVIADRETRLERIIKRDNISRELAAERFSVQQSDDFYTSHSDFVVDGKGDKKYQMKIAEMIKDRSIRKDGG